MQKEFYLFKRNGVYYVKFRNPATGEILNARSSGETNKTAAEKWAARELPKLVQPDITLAEWAAPFFTKDCPHVSRIRLEGRNYSEKVETENRRLLQEFLLADRVSKVKLSEFKKADVLAFRTRLVAQVGRCRRAQKIMSVFQIIMREALFQELIPRDPFLGISKIAYDVKVRRALTREELQRLLDPAQYVNSIHWEATLCAALTGMRAGEVRALQWGDLKGGMIRVVRAADQSTDAVGLPKWGKLRACPYPRALSAVLEPRRGAPDEWVFSIKGGPLGYRWWAEAVKKAGRGIPGASLHALRHTLNTMLREAGVSDELLRGSFGWSAPDIHENYTHREGYNYQVQGAMVDNLLGGIHESD